MQSSLLTMGGDHGEEDQINIALVVEAVAGALGAVVAVAGG